MTERPHDLSDLYLAPVALDLDRRLDELSVMSVEEVRFRVTLANDVEPRSAAEREEALLHTLTSGLELHDWQVSRHPRGLELAHDDRSLVLGIPANLLSYLEA